MSDHPVDPILLSAAKAFRDAAGDRLLADIPPGASMRQVMALWRDTGRGFGYGEDAVIAELIAEMPAGRFAMVAPHRLDGVEYCRVYDDGVVGIRLIRDYDIPHDCKASRLDVIFAEEAK